MATKTTPYQSTYQITSIQPLQKAATTSLTFQLKYGENGYYIGLGIVTETNKP